MTKERHHDGTSCTTEEMHNERKNERTSEGLAWGSSLGREAALAAAPSVATRLVVFIHTKLAYTHVQFRFMQDYS